MRITWGMSANKVSGKCGLLPRILFRIARSLMGLQSRQGRRYPSRTPLRFLQYSADRGHVQAMSQLGCLLYCSGVGRADKRSGLEYLRQAARGGELQAQYWLGAAYLEGQLAPQDDKAALHWLALAAERGHPDAATLLQRCQARHAGAEAVQKSAH